MENTLPVEVERKEMVLEEEEEEPLHFPKVPYPKQLKYSKTILSYMKDTSSNKKDVLVAVLATGSGKTIGYIVPLLEMVKNGDKGIICSRTHRQIRAISDTIKEMWPNNLRCMALGSRKFLCPMTVSNKDFDENCEMLKRIGRCQYYKNTPKNPVPEKGGWVMDIEDIFDKYKESNQCPFYMARRLARHVDILLTPFNYIMSPSIRQNIGLDDVLAEDGHKVNIVIDECGNAINAFTGPMSVSMTETKINNSISGLEKFCRKTFSKFAKSVFNVSIIKGKKLLYTYILVLYTTKIKSKPKEKMSVTEIMKINMNPQKRINIHVLKKCVAMAGLKSSEIKHIKKYVEPAVRWMNDPRNKINAAKVKECISVMEWLVYMKGATQGTKESKSLDGKMASVFLSKFVNLDIPSWFDKKLYKDVDVISINRFAAASELAYDNVDEVFVEFEVPRFIFEYTKNKFTISLKWKTPRRGLKLMLDKKPKSVILTSGSFYEEDILKRLFHGITIDYKTFGQVEALKNNIKVCFANSLDRVPMNFSYKERNGSRIKEKLKLVIDKVYNCNIRGGCVIFFQSYPYMRLVMKSIGVLKSDSIVAKEYGRKVFVDTGKTSAAFKRFSKLAKAKKTAIYLSVSRGKYSEGENFVDSMCRLVIIVGSPFANTRTPQITHMKSYFNNMYAGFGSNLYLYDMVFSVIQMCGRVVRGAKDWGGVLILSNRIVGFEKRFPKWLQDRFFHINKLYDMDNLLEFCEKGYEARKRKINLL